MSPTRRKAALNQIKKDGIKKYNFDQMGLAEPTLQIEHASSKLRGTFTTDVVVWQLLWVLLTKILLQTQKKLWEQWGVGCAPCWCAT